MIIIPQISNIAIVDLYDSHKLIGKKLVKITMKVAFYTLGCKVNQYETQAMEQLLTARGHTIGAPDEACDAYVVNTCSVTAVADKKNRAVIRRLRRAHPDALLAVCGCYSQHAPQSAAALGADLVGGSGNRAAFVDALIEAAETRRARIAVDDARTRREFELLPAGAPEGRTRALLKVQDGCRNFCAYCIIPYTRGGVRSEPIDEAAAQARLLAQQGYREIVVTGIEVASWGIDLPGKPPLESLIGAVCAAVPALRVRLGSLEPRAVTEAFCRALAALPNLCPQFHLSLQSGSDAVLRRMNRRYDTARYYESVLLLRRFFPGCAVTTDLIVGFPGETEAEAAETLAFIRKCAFADMHIFPYSRRPGTPADKMPNQVPAAVKQARAREAGDAAEEMRRAYRAALIGSVQPVLFEAAQGALFSGHAPNYVRVYAEGHDLHNRVVPVRITRLERDGVRGVPLGAQA